MLMGNTDSLRVELALCELIVEVAHYELVGVALHKLIGVVFHNQQKRILISCSEVAHYKLVEVAFHELIELVFHSQRKRILVSCFQETVGAVWHSFFSLTVKMTFS